MTALHREPGSSLGTRCSRGYCGPWRGWSPSATSAPSWAGNSPHDRTGRPGGFSIVQENLRRSLLRHCLSLQLPTNTEAPQYAFFKAGRNLSVRCGFKPKPKTKVKVKTKSRSEERRVGQEDKTCRSRDH